MSVDVLISPRISFSHDLRETEHDSSVPIENFPYSSSSLHSGFEFDFAFIVDSQGSLIRESSSADELFSDGKLLPISIDFAPNTEIINTPEESEPSVLPCFETEEKKKIVKSLKEHLEDSIDIEEEEKTKDDSPSAEALAPPLAIRTFWNSYRSNSLNRLNRAKLNIPSNLRLLSRSKSIGVGVDSLSTKPVTEDDETKAASPSIASRRSFWKIILLRSSSTGKVLEKSRIGKDHEEDKAEEFGIRRSCSLNCNGHNYGRGLIMGRSNSTGSASNLKQIGSKKELQKQSSTKYPSGNAKAAAWKKDRDKGQGRTTSFKDYYGNSNRSERVNSVLNLPSPYISRVTVDFLGIGSLFCTSKSRKKNK